MQKITVTRLLQMLTILLHSKFSFAVLMVC
jgi:hypothetical protein